MRLRIGEYYMGYVWNRKPSKEIKELTLENMRRLCLILSDMCYVALNAFENSRKRKPTTTEAILIIENEIDLIIEQNIKDEEWREIIYRMAIDKYENQNGKVLNT